MGWVKWRYLTRYWWQWCLIYFQERTMRARKSLRGRRGRLSPTESGPPTPIVHAPSAAPLRGAAVI